MFTLFQKLSERVEGAPFDAPSKSEIDRIVGRNLGGRVKTKKIQYVRHTGALGGALWIELDAIGKSGEEIENRKSRLGSAMEDLIQDKLPHGVEMTDFDIEIEKEEHKFTAFAISIGIDVG
jgi:hypothetical protein